MLLFLVTSINDRHWAGMWCSFFSPWKSRFSRATVLRHQSSQPIFFISWQSSFRKRFVFMSPAALRRNVTSDPTLGCHTTLHVGMSSAVGDKVSGVWSWQPVLFSFEFSKYGLNDPLQWSPLRIRITFSSTLWLGLCQVCSGVNQLPLWQVVFLPGGKASGAWMWSHTSIWCRG
jgi:hypothetical protein